MPLRLAFLWHMHQPFYKDLVSGEYRLPWVRMHALKDYFGMVKLLDEFPSVHQTFNLVPSLMGQIEDYVNATARDPFVDVAAKPARDLSLAERRFALQYLFQANETHMIARYPRFRELLEQFRGAGADPHRSPSYFTAQDITDLQVLSQIAWFDEFFLEENDIAELVRKGRDFTEDDQRFVITKERELIGRVLPAYKEAAQKGTIEISTSPFYHPILPLVCDTDVGAVSAPGLALPRTRFRQPEDAREQLKRGLEMHERVFGIRPRGVWPSEGSVSEEVLAIAHELGVEWMATDEGVLCRSLGSLFERDDHGRVSPASAERLYSVYRFEKRDTQMNLLFRDHQLSDLIGFVYSGMPAAEAAQHFITRIKESAQPVLATRPDVVVPIILDGENAWEFSPQSGREFLRRVYAAIEQDPGLEALTISETIARQTTTPKLNHLVPGSWINSNFNVWIGSPEDNLSWDYLADAREFFAKAAPDATPGQRALAFEEVLISEGSDWNWWYGPEHHSANDRDFDELYRKHLSNIYQALGAPAPEYLAQPIATAAARPYFTPQAAYVHPQLDGGGGRYFDWMGAALYTADRTTSAMHGKRFYLDSLYSGIDDANLYLRLDFTGGAAALAGDNEEQWAVVFTIDSLPPGTLEAAYTLRLKIAFNKGGVTGWTTESPSAESGNGSTPTAQAGTRTKKTKASAAKASVTGNTDQQLAGRESSKDVTVAFRRTLESRISLALLQAQISGKLRLRASLWHGGLPVDALPLEGAIELDILTEQDLAATAY
jgi:alpha-amylase/alpha-mannosidase (GH57 family)